MYSFDIFDTLVTRTTKNPIGIFEIMSYELSKKRNSFSEYFCKNFQYIRVNGESECRSRNYNASTEVNLEQIYETIGNYYGLSKKQQGHLLQLELDTERKNLIPINKNLDSLKCYAEKGEQICLISDMYLKESQIRYVLQDIDDLFQTIPIYVSCECGKGKTSGLFSYVYDHYDENIDFWVHCGDNPHADKDSAEYFGIIPDFKPQAQQLDWEEQLFLHDDLASQLLQGASKNARMKNDTQNIAFEIGASLGFPIFFSYIKWVVEESKKRNFKKLYLLARDGYALKSAFEKYIEHMGYEIEVKYLYGSRIAWKIPIFDEKGFSFLKLFHENNIWEEVDIDTYAGLLGIGADELLYYLPEKYKDVRNRYKPSEIANYLDCSINLKKKLAESHSDMLNTVRNYIKQETNDAEHIALVDVQGTAITMTYLEDIISPKKLTVFFAKRTQDFRYKNCEFLSYMIGFDEISAYILETLTRALHGKTVGYVKQDDKYIPKLVDDENVYLEKYGYEQYISGFNAAADELFVIDKQYFEWADWNNQTRKYIDYLVNTDNVLLMNWFGEIPFSDEKLGKEVIVKFAPQLTHEQIRNYILRGYVDRRGYQGICLDFSIKRMDDEEKKLFTIMQNYRIEERTVGNADSKPKPKDPNSYRINLNDFPNGAKIILYGAGNVGQQLYKQLMASDKLEVVLWVDKDSFTYRKQGLPVCRICDIFHVDYDAVIVAVARASIANEIEDLLIQRGLNKKKIYWKKYIQE